MSGLDRLLAATLARAAAAPVTEPLPAFRAALRVAWAGQPLPFDRAVTAGILADRLGHAFAGAYDCALRALVPTLPEEGWACLCVTELGGAHPRAIATTVRLEGDELVLDGQKAWATLAGEGDTLLIAASAGWEGDKNLVRLVRVPAGAPGLRRTAMPETPFTPEIPHYALELVGVRVPSDAALPGDGYAAYVKPFRVLEDLHVSAAAAAYLLGVAVRGGWDGALIARLCALIAALRAVATADLRSPGVLVALEGAMAGLTSVVGDAMERWTGADPSAAARWRRDASLLRVAGKARRTRFEQALGVVTTGR